MNALRTYDYLTLARARVFGWARPLTPEQYGREFPIGPGTLGKVLTHTMISEWYYIERLLGREVPPYAAWPIRDETPPAFPDLVSIWTEQAKATRAALAGVRDWDAPVRYRVTDDSGRLMEVRASAGDLFTQLALHEVHHRAQAMNILRQLGAKVEEIDFNSMMYDRKEVSV